MIEERKQPVPRSRAARKEDAKRRPARASGSIPDRKRARKQKRVRSAMPRAARRRRAIVRVLGAVTVLLLIIAIGAAWIYWSTFIKPTVDVEAGVAVQIEIPAGATTADIGRVLSEAGVVANPNAFRKEALDSGLDASLKPGVYDLFTGMPYEDVIDMLAAGPPIDYITVTIPEGWVIEQMAERFQDEAGISAEAFITIATSGSHAFEHWFLAENPTDSLEGYLFPKTYRIEVGATAEQVVRTMLDQFGREIEGLDLSYPESIGLSTHDWVTLASMIEREVSVTDERELVSSVIYNRLIRGMKLEIDATIEYILPGTRPRLLNEHLLLDSPYNTYMYGGLPLGPIASPGLAALEAAASPAATEYLYYVLTSADGSHTFAETYQEFLTAKEKSRGVVP